MLLRDKLYVEIRDKIINGILAPGAMLRLADLAEDLKVSRTPVREALRRLEDERLVETVASRWTRVAPLDIDSAVQLYPIRWALDGVAVRTTASFSAEALHQMEEANDKLAHAVSHGDASAAEDADDAFHLALINASGNNEIVSMVELIRSRLLRFAKAYWDEGTIGAQSVTEHAGVIAQLAAQDHEGGAQAIEQHWRNSLSRMVPVHARSLHAAESAAFELLRVTKR